MRSATIFIAVAFLVQGAAEAANKKPAGPPLTRDQLQRCVFLDEEQERQRNRYNLQVRQGNELVKQQAQMRGELDQMKLAIESGEAFRMDAYNAKVDDYNAIGPRHDEFKLRMAEIAEEQRVIVEEFNRSCAGRSFRNSDYLDAKRRRK